MMDQQRSKGSILHRQINEELMREREKISVNFIHPFNSQIYPSTDFLHSEKFVVEKDKNENSGL